jgi:hypothetical protein
MIELLLLLGAAFVGYKLVTSSSTTSTSTDGKRSETDAGTREAPRPLDTRTDSARKAAGEVDLLKKDFEELPPEIRQFVLKVLADPLSTPKEIEEGAEAFLQGCGKDLQAQARALVAGGSTPTTDAEVEEFLKNAMASWCFPTAAARLLKIAKERQLDLDEAQKEDTGSLDPRDRLPAAEPAGGGGGPVVIKRDVPKVITDLDLKGILRASIQREIDSLPDVDPYYLRTNVAKLVRLTEGRADIGTLNYDPEFVRTFAKSVEEYYGAKKTAKILHRFADALETYQANKAEIDAAYDAARRAQEGDVRAEADWPLLWNFDDRIFQPDFRKIARSIAKVVSSNGDVSYEYVDGAPLDASSALKFILALAVRVAAKAAYEYATGGGGGDEGGIKPGDDFTLGGVLKLLKTIISLIQNGKVRWYKGDGSDLPEGSPSLTATFETATGG